ncbi:MAG: hypothetical protein JXQ71_05940 [Verrucomicrobia bacterium]|nr:hypothetical protein [Verrucomicrobiota bacterium]
MSPSAVRNAALVILLACAAVACAAAELNPDRWRWSNPLPHGNNVFDLLVSGDLAVEVGDAGTLYVQWDGGRWAPAITGVSNYLRSVTLFGLRFIAVGENGCILWSDDGKVFQRAVLSPATTDWFEGVAASTQRAVAVGDNGSIYTTTDGTNWTQAASGTAEWLRGVAFGNGAFVAVGENGTVRRSTSGTTWNHVAVSTTNHLNRIRYLGNGTSGQFITVGDGGAALALASAQGSSGWTSLASGTTNNLFDVAVNDTGTLLVGDQEIRFQAAGESTWTNHITSLPTNAPPAWTYLSAWGATNAFLVAGRTGMLLEGSRTNNASLYAWQPLPFSSHAWLWDLTVQNSLHVAVGDLATILTSLDGVLWAREVVPGPTTNTVLLGVGGTTNLLLAAGNAGQVFISRAGLTNLTVTNLVGTNLVITNTTFNTLGVVWSPLPPFTSNNLQGVAALSNRFVLSGARGSIYTSPDGSNWTAQTTPTTNFLSSVVALPEGWIATGDHGTLLRAGPDAVTWSPVSLATTNWLYRARCAGNRLVVVGQDGTICTADPDGSNWTLRTSGTTARLNDVTFVDGVWYVVGNQGTVLASTNLDTWTPVRTPTIKSIFAAAAWEGQLSVAGIEGLLLRNPVLPRTSPVNFLGYHRSVATNTPLPGIGGTPIPTSYELFLFGGEPDQYFKFQSCTNLAPEAWINNATLELFDPSGTLYLLRTRDLTNTPPREFYRTVLNP